MDDLTIDIGIEKDDRDAITEGLSRLLADTYTLYFASSSSSPLSPKTTTGPMPPR